MSSVPPGSTGYEAHAAVSLGFGMGAAARRAVDLGVPSDEEMVEDDRYDMQQPGGYYPGHYGKSSGARSSGYGRFSSSPDLNRHDPLHGGRRKSPEQFGQSYAMPVAAGSSNTADPRCHRGPYLDRGDKPLASPAKI